MREQVWLILFVILDDSDDSQCTIEEEDDDNSEYQFPDDEDDFDEPFPEEDDYSEFDTPVDGDDSVDYTLDIGGDSAEASPENEDLTKRSIGPEYHNSQDRSGCWDGQAPDPDTTCYKKRSLHQSIPTSSDGNDELSNDRSSSAAGQPEDEDDDGAEMETFRDQLDQAQEDNEDQDSSNLENPDFFHVSDDEESQTEMGDIDTTNEAHDDKKQVESRAYRDSGRTRNPIDPTVYEVPAGTKIL